MKMNIPNFIHIGPGRSGTTYVYEMFRAHPQIELAKGIKETNFFNNNFDKGLDWYFKFFQDSEESKVCGEISNTYIYSSDALYRISKTLPEVKIITIFRNPYERIISVYNFRKKIGKVDKDFLSTLYKYPEILKENFYGTMVKDLLSFFPKENIFIGFFDEVKADPTLFMSRLYDFLEVDHHFPPLDPKTKINKSVNLRFSSHGRFYKKIAAILRKLELYSFLESVKGSSIVKNAIYKNSRSDDVFEFTDSHINSINSEIRVLESELNLNLSHWYK